jgi:hypothetical protein
MPYRLHMTTAIVRSDKVLRHVPANAHGTSDNPVPCEFLGVVRLLLGVFVYHANDQHQIGRQTILIGNVQGITSFSPDNLRALVPPSQGLNHTIADLSEVSRCMMKCEIGTEDRPQHRSKPKTQDSHVFVSHMSARLTIYDPTANIISARPPFSPRSLTATPGFSLPRAASVSSHGMDSPIGNTWRIGDAQCSTPRPSEGARDVGDPLTIEAVLHSLAVG